MIEVFDFRLGFGSLILLSEAKMLQLSKNAQRQRHVRNFMNRLLYLYIQKQDDILSILLIFFIQQLGIADCLYKEH